MGDKTTISWVQNEDGTPGHTFNPVWGCTKVSPGCDHCYAESMANRFGKWWGQGTPRREFGDKHWNDPVRWNRAAEKSGIRHRVFCASMADVFDKDWPKGTRERLWELIKATPWLDWIIVTKRIGNAKRMLPADWGSGYLNVWLLITVVTQAEADRDTAKLAATPALIRGLSVEPQIESVAIDYETEWALDWVICGSESGPHRRPFDLDWARALRDQCAAAGIQFFLKQTPGGTTRKGVIETPELDGQKWTQMPGSVLSPTDATNQEQKSCNTKTCLT